MLDVAKRALICALRAPALAYNFACAVSRESPGADVRAVRCLAARRVHPDKSGAVADAQRLIDARGAGFVRPTDSR